MKNPTDVLYDKIQRAWADVWTETEVKTALEQHRIEELRVLREAASHPAYGARLRSWQSRPIPR